MAMKSQLWFRHLQRGMQMTSFISTYVQYFPCSLLASPIYFNVYIYRSAVAHRFLHLATESDISFYLHLQKADLIAIGEKAMAEN